MNDLAPMDALVRLNKDLRQASKTLSKVEIRFLVKYYYSQQDDRKRSANRSRTLVDEPHAVIDWLTEQSGFLEGQIKISLDVWTANDPVSIWARSQVGIGPVLAAGLSAYLDMDQAPTVGHIWAYCGLDPTKKWLKGEPPPWNLFLKTLCWKIGESFLKVYNNENSYYGAALKERWEIEKAKNEAGEFADQANRILLTRKLDKTTELYKAVIEGKLSKGHILARSKRWTVKLFLAHWHHVAHWETFGTAPPKPYVIDKLGHAHYLGPPGYNR